MHSQTAQRAGDGPEAGRRLRKFATKAELQRAYAAQAKQNRKLHALPQSFPVFASTHQLGAAFGVGVGLYFQLLTWLALLFTVLTIFAVPFWIVVNQSVFTDYEHQYNHEYGVKVYESPTLFSFTFAAIVGGSADNGTLEYMNTDIAGMWHGPMKKGNFLTWISLVDAASVIMCLACITIFTLKAARFVRLVDAKTLEASDYTLLVQGVPKDADVQELGMFFSRFGKVMDVVLVRDVRRVLSACAAASKLEQRRALQADQMRMYDSELHQRRAEDTERKLGKVLERMEQEHGGPQDFPAEAAFVTFNRGMELQACLASCPHGWFSSLFTPQPDRLRGTHALWVTKAAAPEDYIFENIPCSWVERCARLLLTRAIIFSILLLCAATITKLSTVSLTENTTIPWLTQAMQRDIGKAASKLMSQAVPSYLQSGIAAVAAQLHGLYLSTVVSSVQSLATQGVDIGSVAVGGGVDDLVAGSANWTSYCSAALPLACVPYFGSLLSGAGFTLSYGSLVQWQNTTAMLVQQRPLISALQSCAQAPSGQGCDTPLLATTLALPACLPCYCLGLSQAPGDMESSSVEWRSLAQTQCDPYVDGWDVRIWGIRIAIAVVIAALNSALKTVLEFLVLLEKHWTRSEQERSYAAQAFISQLLNSALVLLLVNASPVANASKDTAQQGSWKTVFKYFVLNGQYNDFSMEWYTNVGLSVLVLMMIQALTPVMTVAADLAWKITQRCYVTRCTSNAAQDQYNEAFARPNFNLQQRVADIMLNVTVALMFGSGMPLCYLIAVCIFLFTAAVERYALIRLCGIANRYSRQLPDAIIALLPWATLSHCVLGIWMHTYFKVQSSDLLPDTLTMDLSPSATDDSSSGPLSNALGGSSVVLVTEADNGLRTAHTLLTRITQPNGIALLVCAAVILIWMLFRNLLWHAFRPCAKRVRCCWRLFATPGPSPVAFESALRGGLLSGSATYRLPHQPSYTSMFTGRLHQALWARAHGPSRYTYVVSGGGAGPHDLVVSPDLVLAADLSDLEAALVREHVPKNLAAAAGRLATPSIKGTPPKLSYPQISLLRMARGARGNTAAGSQQLPRPSSDTPPPRSVHIMALAPDVAAAMLPQDAFFTDVAPAVQLMPSSGVEPSASAVVTISRAVRGSPGFSSTRVSPVLPDTPSHPPAALRTTTAQGVGLADVQLLEAEPCAAADQAGEEQVTATGDTHTHAPHSGPNLGAAAFHSYRMGAPAVLGNDSSPFVPSRPPHTSPQHILPEASLMLARDRLQALASATTPALSPVSLARRHGTATSSEGGADASSQEVGAAGRGAHDGQRVTSSP